MSFSLRLLPFRCFSTTHVDQAGYKLKSHSGAKKRWRSLASGSSFKRGKAGHQHLNVSKSASRKNELSTTAYSNEAQTRKLKKMLLPYGTMPQEVLEHIALCLGSASFLGPPADLVPLLLTSRECHSRLSMPDNPYLYAQIFRSKFDTTAARTRLGGPHRLTPVVLAEELKRRCVALKRLRARLHSKRLLQDEGEPPPLLREVLFTAYVLVLEDEGKNMAQLEEYGRIREWLDEFWFDPRGSSSMIHSMRAGVWPLERVESALGMWLFWLLFNPEHHRTSESRALESPLHIFKAMAFGAPHFNLTSNSWLHYDTQPDQDPVHFTWYSEQITFRPPPLATPAILAYFSLPFPSAFGMLTPTPPHGSPLPHPVWQEWDLEWERGLIKSSDRRITDCFRPGSIEGLWEGFFSYTDFEVYARLLEGGPPSVVQRCIVGRHKQTWKLREYHLLSSSSSPSSSNSGGDDDDFFVDERPLPGGDPLSSYFPPDLRMRESGEGITIHHPSSKKTRVYRRFDNNNSSQPNAGTNPNRNVRDVIIAGEGHSAWGQFKLIGRVRPCDGFISLLKDYSNGTRGQWLYRSYLVGDANGTLAGRWRDTMTPVERAGYEGCFVMCHRR